MKKCILLLINGFGIERKDSIEIYNKSLMPTLDSLSQKYIFGSLYSIVNDYNNGYRIFSIPQENTSSLDNVDRAIEDRTINSNEAIIKLQSEMPTDNKIHLFYTLETGQKLFQVKELLKVINPNKTKKIYLHIILTSSSLDDYLQIDKAMGKLAFELGEYCKIGIVIGKNKLDDESITKTILREYGEHWGEYAKKLEILKRDVISPADAIAFYVNGGFQLTKGDRVLFLNYKELDLSKIISIYTANNIELFSLYELPNCTKLFEKESKEVDCFFTKLKRTAGKVLLLTDKEKIDDINYYLNGMQQGTIPNMTYAVRNTSFLKNNESIINILSTNQYDGIIVDFNISIYNNVEDIKGALKEIDEVLSSLLSVSIELDATLIVSSLFGMHATIMDGTIQKTVNFSGKVPCIIVSNEFTKRDYSISNKSTYDLSNAFISCISDIDVGSGIIHKKSFIDKLLKK